MTETAQIVIISVITILTIVLSLVGFQAFMLLKELRESIRKTTSILDDVDHITTKISHSTESISGVFEGLQSVVGLIGAFKKGFKRDE